MNKSELLVNISEKSGLKKVEAERALNAFIETVTEFYYILKPRIFSGFFYIYFIFL